MPRREEPFETNVYYHVYNRGVAKQPIFNVERHYFRFERSLNYYLPVQPALSFSRFLRLAMDTQAIILEKEREKTEHQVEIVSYCLMPNHFHLLLRQLVDGGISTFMQKAGNSYTRYFNTVTNRVGPIFQGQFKAVRVSSEEQLLHVSRYIHINPVMAKLVSSLSLIEYKHSSYSQYVNGTPSGTIFVNPSIILDRFSPKNSYENFCMDYVDYGSLVLRYKQELIDADD